MVALLGIYVLVVGQFRSFTLPLVVVASPDLGTASVQALVELARARPVLVINSTGLRLPTPRNADRPVERIVRKLRSMRHPVTRPLPSVPGLVLLTPLGLPPVGIRSIDRLSTRVIAAQVSRAARRLGIRDPWVVSALPTSQEVTEHLGWRRVVYYRADDHAANPGVDRAGVTALEDALMARAATVLYSSRSLMERESGRSGAIAVFFDHGVDLEHFRPRRDRSDQPAALSPQLPAGRRSTVSRSTSGQSILSRLRRTGALPAGRCTTASKASTAARPIS